MYVTFFALLTVSKRQILDSSKLESFANDNLNLMKMTKCSYKGNTAYYEPFSHFPPVFSKDFDGKGRTHCILRVMFHFSPVFSKDFYYRTVKRGLFGKGLKTYLHFSNFNQLFANDL